MSAETIKNSIKIKKMININIINILPVKILI